jgi:hypothetical protein
MKLGIVLNKFGDLIDFGDFKIFYNNLPLLYPQDFLFFLVVEKFKVIFFGLLIVLI